MSVLPNCPDAVPRRLGASQRRLYDNPRGFYISRGLIWKEDSQRGISRRGTGGRGGRGRKEEKVLTIE